MKFAGGSLKWDGLDWAIVQGAGAQLPYFGVTKRCLEEVGV
jgi:hypothetical protein